MVLVRWWRTLRGLMCGARVHPQAVLVGRRAQVCLGRGSKLGARTTLDAGTSGVIDIGANVWVAADVEIQTDSRISIGAGSSIQRRATINGDTRLGAGCILAPNVFVSSGTHPFRWMPHLPIREQEKVLQAQPARADLDRPVWIQDDCWLGVNAVVCPGVTIGKGSVVGANAVVTRDVPPFSVVAGAPARIIGQRLDWRPPAVLDFSHSESQAYLLAGLVGRDGVRRAVSVTSGAGICVALDPQAAQRGYRIHGVASDRLRLFVNGRAIDVEPGTVQLTIPPEEAQAASRFHEVRLQLAQDLVGEALQLERIEVC